MPTTYPLQKKGHTLEFLREIAHLRVRSNTFGAAFRVRNALTHAIHTFFQERGFLYVHTPIITTSDCEGAGQMFSVTTLNLQQPPRAADGKVDWQQDFFGQAGLSHRQRPARRRDLRLGVLQSLHLRPDVSRRELQHAAPPGRVLDDRAGDGLLRAGRQHAAGRGVSEVSSFATCSNTAARTWSSSTSASRRPCWRRLEHVAESNFGHITYTEAIAELKKSGKTWEFPVEWGNDLQTEHERYLTEEVFKKPVIVTTIRRTIKAFYMRVNDDGKTVRAMDVLVPRVGEIIGGSQREERHDVLAAAAARQRAWTKKPTGGISTCAATAPSPTPASASGLERMMMYLTGMKNIRDVIPFPRTPGNAEF